jgi:hypothetical protein
MLSSKSADRVASVTMLSWSRQPLRSGFGYALAIPSWIWLRRRFHFCSGVSCFIRPFIIGRLRRKRQEHLFTCDFLQPAIEAALRRLPSRFSEMLGDLLPGIAAPEQLENEAHFRAPFLL